MNSEQLAKIQDNKRIGLMGGTFDPVHFAHTGLALAAAEELGFEKVIMIPAFIQPFKKDKYVTSDEHRLEMLRIAVEQYDNLQVSTWEIERGGISYTYDTVMHFKEEYPDKDLWFIMGSDSLMKLENWYKGTDLLRICSFAVGTRPMDDTSKLDETIHILKSKYGTEIYPIKQKMLPINSTMVRDLLEREEPISGLVLPGVENYIYENKLYI